MNKLRSLVYGVMSVFMLVAGGNAAADSVTNSTVGAGGYDLVSYHTGDTPVAGSGRLLATVDGVNYLFSTQENLDTFKADQDKYLPQYGGYCAFGASVGKKYIGDPNVFSVVEGKLYLNLDKKVQNVWNKDIPGYIETADVLWKTIEAVPASDL